MAVPKALSSGFMVLWFYIRLIGGGSRETMSWLRVSPDILGEPGIELGAPGYKASVLYITSLRKRSYVYTHSR